MEFVELLKEMLLVDFVILFFRKFYLFEGTEGFCHFSHFGELVSPRRECLLKILS